ncbi:MAG TPA: trehalase family glycosidase [Candidatus Saccharimonadales bacterium]|nr:trehalase family glycosidase [Candidatus Saccharimonadales bacterium]
MFGFHKTKISTGKIANWSFRPDKALKPEDVQDARQYINQFWPKLTRFHPKDDGGLLGLPKPYLVPAYEEGHEFDFNELYYWDSYFLIQGILDKDNKELVMGILDDLMTLFERFKIVPNASRTYLTGRSQPPFLTSFIWDLFQTYNLDKKWLERSMSVAEEEYKTVWMGTSKPNARLVYRGLSRYYDINYINELAQAESGWDMTPRFGRHTLEYVPVDLNALLYKYEIDFGRTARLLGDKRKAAEWETSARHRKQTINELMWDKGRGLYYDYNYAKEKKGNVSSLASYYTMWAGLANEEQAKQMVGALKRFENKGGLATTDSLPIGQYVLGSIPTQWAYPNGWAPLHFLVIYGLQRYGYVNDAWRISNKWLKTNLAWYEKHHVFLEKYNVVQPDKPPIKGVYPSQTGFGWTNSVFERLCKDFIDAKI